MGCDVCVGGRWWAPKEGARQTRVRVSLASDVTFSLYHAKLWASITRLALDPFLKVRVDYDSLILGVRLFHMTLPLYIGALANFFVVGFGTFSGASVPRLVIPHVHHG